MKHIYLEKKYIRYNNKRSADTLKRLSEIKQTKNTFSNRSVYVSRIIVEAPKLFSIINNTTETIEFFNKIEIIAYKYRQLFIDVKNVEVLTPETVLYMLLIIEKIIKVKTIRVSGNAPVNDECRQMFLDSGFYDFVRSNYRTSKNVNILSVKSENYVDGKIANEVIEFASLKLELTPSKITRAFYTTILECMGNTKEHAYNSHDAKYAKWWLIAQYDSNLCKINFAILDNGKGIPETVRKKLFERVLGYNDSEVLKSVLMGEFRTSTELQYRGKGLPKIMFFMKEKLIQEVHVLANNGFYNLDKNITINVMPKFNGTLICWSFIKGVCNENSVS